MVVWHESHKTVPGNSESGPCTHGIPHSGEFAVFIVFLAPVLRQNSRRAENSAISCCDGGPIQVIPSPSSAKNLSRGIPRGVPVYIKDGGTRTFSRRYVGAN